jgi:hypothetical protein
VTGVLYPAGYGTDEVELDALFARYGVKMHPEFRRRLRAMIEASNGLVGIGGGWRSSLTQAANYARDPRTFAPPGSSFHEYQTFASGIRAYQAVDTVGADTDDDGRRESVEHQAAWKWIAENARRFGLMAFGSVNNEPWHVQCSDLPTSVSKWKSAGSPDPDPSFVLPGSTPAPAPTPAPPAPGGSFMHATVRLGDVNADVFALQVIVRHRAGQTGVACDGTFDSRTDAAVRNVQGFCGLVVDGIVGPKSWAVLDGLANS